MSELRLFTEPEARATDPDTSKAAAAKVAPGHAKRLALIAEMVGEAGPRGMTADEIWARACLDDPSQLSRKSTWHGATSRCAAEGRIVPKGPKLVRLSVNNTPQRIYVAPRWLP